MTTNKMLRALKGRESEMLRVWYRVRSGRNYTARQYEAAFRTAFTEVTGELCGSADRDSMMVVIVTLADNAKIKS